MEEDATCHDKVVFPKYGIFLERGKRILAFNPNTLVVAEVNNSAKLMLEALRQPIEVNIFLKDLGTFLPHWNKERLLKARRLLYHWLQEGLIEIAGPTTKRLVWRYNPREAPPLEVYISPTDQCNLSCIYCYNREFRHKPRKTTTPKLNLSQWLDVLSEAKSIGCKRAVFTGGEPLISPLLRPLVHYCKQIGLEVRLLSNGTLIDEDWAEWITRNVDLVNISLDSAVLEQNDAVRGVGSFKKITRGIRNLMMSGAKSVYVRAVVTTYNVQSLPDLVDYCYHEFGCAVGAPTIFIPFSLKQAKYSGLIPDFETYFEKVFEFTDRSLELTGKNPWEEFNLEYACRCGVGSSTVSIDPRGNVYPCQSLHNDDMCAGNIRNGGFEHIYRNSPVLNRLRTVPLDDIPVCRDCSLVTVCGAGCRAIAWNLYGSVTAYNELFCPLYKKGTIEKLWRWIMLDRSDKRKQLK
jgi:radical SAM protein with 4Fe4S-binding SPASM domain